MTMAFKVEDPSLLAKFTAGKKTAFEFKQEGKDYVITSVE
jgi:Cu/Ag efflux protein CusF